STTSLRTGRALVASLNAWSMIPTKRASVVVSTAPVYPGPSARKPRTTRSASEIAGRFADHRERRLRIAVRREITQGKDADRRTVVDHRKPSYRVLTHEIDRALDGIVRSHVHEVPAADLTE